MDRNFGTVLNCIDGRTLLPVINWMKGNFNVDFVDLITEPGIDKVLSDNSSQKAAQIRDKTIISITAHQSKVLALAGHHDCAANPSNTQKHIEAIKKSILTVTSWQLPINIIGLWLDEYWNVHQIEIDK